MVRTKGSNSQHKYVVGQATKTTANQRGQRRRESISFLQQIRLFAFHFEFDNAGMKLTT